MIKQNKQIIKYLKGSIKSTIEMIEEEFDTQNWDLITAINNMKIIIIYLMGILVGFIWGYSYGSWKTFKEAQDIFFNNKK